eukprot:TRINITY_DN32798_c0_g1_i1.p1 TRINITY_DN32798_c0_g1~~TRINITY_DN32798_c0_g1_i1.p1  ORF type:complete len:533 (-),score=77.02 TRINITY_DN32798_c0_g1_i1:114-1655(-)
MGQGSFHSGIASEESAARAGDSVSSSFDTACHCRCVEEGHLSGPFDSAEAFDGLSEVERLPDWHRHASDGYRADSSLMTQEVHRPHAMQSVISLPAVDDTRAPKLADTDSNAHPVTFGLPESGVFFPRANALCKLPVPWPRCQDLFKSNIHVRPKISDLVVAVSHMWFYQSHPDPLGEKASLIQDLLDEVELGGNSQSQTLLFVDFLSMTQRPFSANQAARNDDEERDFGIALQAMPLIYLRADAVVLLDCQAQGMVPGEGEVVVVGGDEINDAKLLEIGSAVQIESCGGNEERMHAGLPKGKVSALDFLLRINGKPVTSTANVAKELFTAGRPELARVEVAKAPFGKRNTTPAATRGWIYLERFIAMVKVAMMTVESEAEHHFIFSDSETLLEEIRSGGKELQQAAQAGEDELRRVLEGHVKVLKLKTFAANSTDKMTNTGGVGGGDVARSDQESVEAIMASMVEFLREHWAAEAKLLRRARLRRAVKKITAISRLSMANFSERPFQRLHSA